MSETSERSTSDEPVVLVTGGLSGIGAAVALAFASDRGRIVLYDRDDTRRESIVAAIEAAGGEALVVMADVRDDEALRLAAARALERFGRIDALVACAGIADQSTVATGDPDRWRAVVDINLLGTIYAAHAVLPAMLAQGSGHIFVIASIAGRDVYVGEPVYIASKWGQVGFAHALRQEVMDAGVRVSVIEPGIVDTPLTRDNPVVAPLLAACEPLTAVDVAAAIRYAFRQPARVVLSELAIRPSRQRAPEFHRTAR
jgi:NADP-dependent 3-hydroxy acid dehydrogenase YdfG